MNITLYHNTMPLDHISRTFTQAATLTGTLREGCNILNPDIRVKYNVGYLQCNYAYIADFGRYYYFREPPTIEGDLMTIHLKADTLYNYRDVILKSYCIAERSTSNFELMLEDSAVSAVAGYDVFSRSLPYSFRPDQGIYVLIVAGGS